MPVRYALLKAINRTDHPARACPSNRRLLAAANRVFAIVAVSTPAFLRRPDREPLRQTSRSFRRPIPQAIHLLSAPLPLEMAINIGDLPPCCSRSCPPEPRKLPACGSVRAAAGNGNMPVGQPLWSPATPHDPLIFFVGPRRRCLRRPRQPTGCYLDAAAIPAAQLLAFTLDRWCRAASMPRPASPSSNPPSDGVEKAATQDFQTTFPYTWLAWCQATGRVVGALFAALPRQLADSTQTGSCTHHFAPGRSAVERSPNASELIHALQD